MKNRIVSLLLVCGLFSVDADEDEVKSVSVMEGDSVTLHTGLTVIQTSDVIRWRFGEGVSRDLLVDIDINCIRYNGPLKDRLQTDIQTGDLTITNMRIKHSGPYEVQINRAGTTYKRFRVNVTVAPSVVSAGEVKSVTEGDSVTLHTDVQTQRDDLILWRFGDDGVLIAKDDKEDNKSSKYDADGRFRDRLKLDEQTGSLIITNTKTTDTGLYQLKISSNRDTKYKTFSVSVSVRDGGLSSGGVVGIVFGVLLCIVGVFVFRRINYERQKQIVTEKTVIEDVRSVTLESDVTKLQYDDVIEWSFRDKVIVIFSMNNKLFTDEQRLRDRLKVDDQTGSLTIRDIRSQDAGLYKVKISSSSRLKSFLQFITGGGPSYYQFNVIVTVSKVENSSVTLDTGVTELQTDDVIQWMFGDEQTLIAQISKKNKISTEDVRFRDRLRWCLFGSLTITDLRTEHTGHYIQKIISRSRGTSYNQIYVIVEDEMRAVELEGCVTLKTGVTELQGDDKIKWTFGDEETLIAQMIGWDKPSLCDFIDERFRDRLKLDPQTGDLTISNATVGCTGLYQVQIHSRRRDIEYIGYKVAVFVYCFKGESLTLHTDSKIQSGTEIQWIYDKTRLVTGKNETKYTDDERFKDRLKMNPHTGDLTITDTRLTDKGVYTFQRINSDGKISYRIIQIFVREERIKTVELGGSVTLETGVTEIHTKIEWTLSRENLPIAQMTVGSEPSYNSNDERFRDRLMMDPQTGDLTITNITSELTEDYAVNIHSPRRETEYRIFIVASLVIVDKGESVTLHTDCEIQSDSEIKWMLDDVFRLVTVKNKENSEIKYSDDERFRGRLEMNPETGDLTITDIRQTDTGVYKFHHFISYENTSCRAFRILFRGTEETESTTVLMPLLNEADVDRSSDVQDHIINIYSKESSLLS